MQSIVFDFGNVVGFFDHALTLRRLAPHTDMPSRTMRELIYDGDLEDAYEAGRITSREFLSQFRQLCRLRCDEDTIAAAFVDVFQPNLPLCNLLPALKKRYRLFLGSNTNELHSLHYRRQFAEHLKFFDGLVLSHEIGARKPSPLFFEHCWRLAECPARACVFVDDLPANIEGARRCGWQGILFTDLDNLKEQLAGLGIVI
jgi:FMN phosphatase YigB (HAD superfamily)